MSDKKDNPAVPPDLVNQNNDPFGDIEPVTGPMQQQPPPQPVIINPPRAARHAAQVPEELSRKIQEQVSTPPPLPQTSLNEQGRFRREIFLAVIQGFAARGELSRRQPGTTIGVVTDADVQNICRHAAGVASFAYEATKAARISS